MLPNLSFNIEKRKTKLGNKLTSIAKMKHYRHKKLEYLPAAFVTVFKWAVIAGVLLNIIYAIWQQFK